MLLVLIDRPNEPALGADEMGALAGLGISSVSLLRDDPALAVVMEGWAFDPVRSGDAAIAAILASHQGVRVLHPVAHIGVTQEAQSRPDSGWEGGVR